MSFLSTKVVQVGQGCWYCSFLQVLVRGANKEARCTMRPVNAPRNNCEFRANASVSRTWAATSFPLGREPRNLEHRVFVWFAAALCLLQRFGTLHATTNSPPHVIDRRPARAVGTVSWIYVCACCWLSVLLVRESVVSGAPPPNNPETVSTSVTTTACSQFRTFSLCLCAVSSVR